MNSFDFYDTLFTRLVGEPRAVFQLMEENLGRPGFAARRVAAETAARRAAGGAEIGLADIYRQFGPEDSNRETMELELRLERELISPVASNLARLTDSDIVVSDMYLPSQLLKDVVSSHSDHAKQAALVVSNEVRLRKSDGSLWKHLLQQYPGLKSHVGDSLKGDVLHPKRAGLRAEHYRGAELNRYERRYVAAGTVDGQVIAGVSRAARLSAPSALSTSTDSRNAAIENVMSSVMAPVFVAFVEHVIDDALKAGIQHLHFLARDGQVLNKIANAFIDARGLPLQAHYIYGSRHALHLPGLTSIERAEAWLLDDTPHLSLAEVAGRGELPEELMREVGARFGLTDFDANIPVAQRSHLKQIIRSPEISAELQTNSASRRQQALDYYAQVGLRPGARVALVDVGWRGNMQASLRAVLDRGDGPPVTLRGYYLCLSTKLKVSEHDTLLGYLHDPDSFSGPCPFDPYRCVIEACLMADHGTTLGFEGSAGEVRPVLAPPPSEEVLGIIKRQQDAVMRFVHLLLKVEHVRGRRLQWPQKLVAQNLLLMFSSPLRLDAQAFAGRGFFEGQADNLRRDIVRTLPLGMDWLRRQAMGLWPEGTLTLSGGSSLLSLVRAARWTKGLVRP